MSLSPPRPPSQAPAILFEDAEALVIDKPPRLDVTTPRRGGPSVETWLPELRLGFARPPLIVHRLDRDTSGCLLLARNERAQKRFAAAFEAGQVTKTYLAILAGIPSAESGVIELSLAKTSTRSGGWRIIPARKGKPALTRWRMLASEGGRALVEFAPETGRTHQLRVHAASGLACPIWGDPVYGAAEAGGLMLHAASLALDRAGKAPVVAQAPWPARFEQAGFAHD